MAPIPEPPVLRALWRRSPPRKARADWRWEMAELHVVEGGKRVSSEPEQARTFDLQAEAALVGNVVHDPNALDEVRGQLSPEHFYSEAHRRIYEACCEVRDAGD